MLSRIVLLSGPVSSGKSTLAKRLEELFEFRTIKTHDLIRQLVPGISQDRRSFQRAGQSLDRKYGGQWVARALANLSTNHPEWANVTIDAVRISEQIEAMRTAFGPRVLHIHLTASDRVLEKRYARKKSQISELKSYAEVKKNSTEKNIVSLAPLADVLIDTDRNLPGDILIRAASRIGLYGATFHRNVDVLVGGQYGSEGKGQVAAYLSKEYDILVRVGGPNAGHKVWAHPEPFTFHHLPSGTESSEAVLVVGPGAVLRLKDLLSEVAEHSVSPKRLFIDPNAMLIDDSDIVAEKPLEETIGSTARGVGSATARKVMRTAAKPPVHMAGNEPKLRQYIRPSREVFEAAYSTGRRILLEGTQGTALSLHHGFYPYVTSRDTTVAGCLAEAGISPARVRKIVMVCRTYPIRVQNPKGSTSGPMSQEIKLNEISRRSGVPLRELRKTETTSTTQRKRRIAEFDWGLLRYGSVLNSPTDIALTFVDYLNVKNQKARRFNQLTTETIHFIEEVERVASAPVSLISTRFHSRSIIDRRTW